MASDATRTGSPIIIPGLGGVLFWNPYTTASVLMTFPVADEFVVGAVPVLNQSPAPPEGQPQNLPLDRDDDAWAVTNKGRLWNLFYGLGTSADIDNDGDVDGVIQLPVNNGRDFMFGPSPGTEPDFSADHVDFVTSPVLLLPIEQLTLIWGSYDGRVWETSPNSVGGYSRSVLFRNGTSPIRDIALDAEGDIYAVNEYGTVKKGHLIFGDSEWVRYSHSDPESPTYAYDFDWDAGAFVDENGAHLSRVLADGGICRP